MKNLLQIKPFRYAMLLCIIGANIGCDQMSKALVRDRLDMHENIQLIDNHVLLTNVENTGAFLSAGAELSPAVKTLVLSLFPALTLLALMFWLFSQRGLGRGTMFGLCCILGGGIGNVFDRIVYGAVTDFLYLQAGIFHTGVFNFADVSITGGVAAIVVDQIWKNRVE